MLSPVSVVVEKPVLETVSFPLTSNNPVGLDVPTPSVPRKYEVAEVVAIMFPTVSCVPVAISAVPLPLDTMIEFGAKDIDPVPPFAIVCLNVLPPKQVPSTA